MIRVVVADDQALVRTGLRTLLDAEDDVALIGEATDGEHAVALVRRTRPDVVLMDIRMPGRDGLDALADITADPAMAHVRVGMLTVFEHDEYLFQALRAGASGFLLKDAEPAELLRAVRVVAAGESLLSPSVTQRVVQAFARQHPQAALPHPDLVRLTARECEIVAWVATGRSSDEIADALTLSPATVRTHVSRAMTKLHARDRTQLAIYGIRSELRLPPTRAPRAHE